MKSFDRRGARELFEKQYGQRISDATWYRLKVAVFILTSALSAVSQALFPPQQSTLVIHNNYQ